MSSAIDELKQKLETKHPDYKEWEEEWLRYQDVVGDTLVDKKKYLPKNKFEPQDQYDFRIELSQFIPESGLAVSKIIGAIFSEKPKREFPGQEAQLKRFLDNADRKGGSWNSVMETIAFNLLSYGTTRVLVNVPPAKPSEEVASKEGEAVVTRAMEKAADIRPYVVVYKPLDIIDWDVDDDEVLKSLRIREERYLPPLAGVDGKHRKAVKFITYDQWAVRWIDFVQGGKGEWEINGAGESIHELGMVPMVVDGLREVKPMIGHSFLRYSSRADIRKAQTESDQAYDGFIHAHPFLAVWTDDEMKEVGVGSNTWLKLNPGSGGVGREDAQYLQPPASAFDALKQIVEDSRTQIYRQANTDPLGVISGGGTTFQASGVARAWSFGTSEARMLSKIADKLEQIEKRVFEMVLRYEEPINKTTPIDDPVFKGSVQYPEEFDMSSTAALLEETEKIAQMVNSETLLRTLHKRIAASKVGDTTAKELKIIKDEIENNPLIGTMVGKSPQEMAMPDLSKLFGGMSVDGGEDGGEEEEKEEEPSKKEDTKNKQGEKKPQSRD